MSGSITSFTKIFNNPECYLLDNNSDLRFTPRLYISSYSKKEYIDQILKKTDIFNNIKVALFPSNKQSWDFKFRELDETKAFISFLNNRFPESFDVAITIKESNDINGVYLYKPNSNNRLDLQKRFIEPISKVASLDTRHDKLISQPLRLLEDTKHEEDLWTETIWFANHNTRAFELTIPASFSEEKKESIITTLLISASNYLREEFTKEEDPLIRVITVLENDISTKSYRVYLEDLVNAVKDEPVETIDVSCLDETLTQNSSIVDDCALKMKNNEWDWNSSPLLVYRFADKIFLVDGVRRLIAAKKAEIKQIPVKFVDNVFAKYIKGLNSNSDPVVRYSVI